GGNSPRMNVHRAVEVPGASRTVGRISAARQQTNNAAPKASAAPMRLRFTARSSRHPCSVLPGAMLFMLEFTGSFLEIRIGAELSIGFGVVAVECVEIFAAHVGRSLVEQDARVAQRRNTREITQRKIDVVQRGHQRA